MHWRQFLTLLWLRWRLAWNAIRRASLANSMLTTAVVILLIGATLSTFLSTLTLGSVFLGKAPVEVILLIWNIAATLLLVMLFTGLIADIQRSDIQSLRPLLHLPVSPVGGFLISYFGSWLNITTFFFLPSLLALAVASVVARGWPMLLIPLLLLCTLALLTAVVHQLRGWLAGLMLDKRRRSWIAALVIAAFCVRRPSPRARDHVHDGRQRPSGSRRARQGQEGVRRRQGFIVRGTANG